jgi:dipeptidyl aminopeptidase/acylaminoacyl peptidase
MYDLASPISHVSAASPPTLLFQGKHDWIVPVASARRLYHALAAAGVPVVYVEFPRTVHGFVVNPKNETKSLVGVFVKVRSFSGLLGV